MIASMSDIISSFLLIFIAEMGDKSQLVCLSLASRYRARDILIGAIVAFGLLNLVAVLIGDVLTSWIPESTLHGLKALLFIVFAVLILRDSDDYENQDSIIQGRHIIWSVFLLIFLAELGDKTQIAVIALGSTQALFSVWAGATLALVTTSAIGIWAGRFLLKRISLKLLHQLGGAIFLLFALVSAIEFYQSLAD